MKKFNWFLFIAVSAIIVSCSDDPAEPDVPVVIPAQRTVIAILDGNNTLNTNLSDDILEMETGSKKLSPTTNLVIFANIQGQKPYIAEMVDGKKTKVREWDKTFITTDPDTLLSVMQWIVEKYPANEYGIIFGGHGTGNIVKKDTISTTLRPAYAYGWDYRSKTASDNIWINIGTLGTVISHLPRPKFIFFDCCLMQDIGVAGQLKKYTDYIIAPISETPDKGAPYDDITPLLTIADLEIMCDTLLTIYQTYCERTALPICISALRTYYVDDMQVKANAALEEVKEKLQTVPPSYDLYENVIYYFRETDTANPVLYDLKSFLYEQKEQGILSEATYNDFVEAQQKCIFSSRKSDNWRNYRNRIHFSDFSVTAENFGGLSINRETIEEILK